MKTERVRFTIRWRATPTFEDERFLAYLIALSPWLIVIHRVIEGGIRLR